MRDDGHFVTILLFRLHHHDQGVLTVLLRVLYDLLNLVDFDDVLIQIHLESDFVKLRVQTSNHRHFVVQIDDGALFVDKLPFMQFDDIKILSHRYNVHHRRLPFGPGLIGFDQ